MEVKWTRKALADLVRLHNFMMPVNQLAAAHTVQTLATAPSLLTKNPRIVVSKSLEMVDLTVGLFTRFHVNGNVEDILSFFVNTLGKKPKRTSQTVRNFAHRPSYQNS